MVRHLRCFARGRQGNWEAICIDLDLAVQGVSLDDVRAKLDEMIKGYIADAERENLAHAHALLHRKSPIHVRIGLQVDYAVYRLIRGLLGGNGRNDRRDRLGFDVACPA